MLVVETVNVTHPLICMYVQDFFSGEGRYGWGRTGDEFLALPVSYEGKGWLSYRIPPLLLPEMWDRNLVLFCFSFK